MYKGILWILQYLLCFNSTWYFLNVSNHEKYYQQALYNTYFLFSYQCEILFTHNNFISRTKFHMIHHLIVKVIEKLTVSCTSFEYLWSPKHVHFFLCICIFRIKIVCKGNSLTLLGMPQLSMLIFGISNYRKNCQSVD